MEKLQLRETRFYSSLDEPLFKFFAGENISAMISTMGLSANEGVKHPLITAARKNAQENIQKKMTVEPSAASQEEWLRKAIG
jgi:preprotein translocase subunit SecA